MEIKINNLTLKHLIEENRILENGFINNIQTTNGDLLKLKIHTKIGDKTVIFTSNYFYISEKSINAKMNPGGFSSLLKKYLFNQRIISIKQKELDRIIIFEFPSCYLIFEFFSKGNVVLCDKEYKIIKSMRKEKWKDRELKKDEFYKFPTSKGKNVLTENVKDFIKDIKNNPKTCFGAVIDILNIAPEIAEFVFEKNKFEKLKNAKDYNEKEIKKIFQEIKKVYESKSNLIYLNNKILYSIKLDEKKEEKVYPSINNALNELTQICIKKEENKVELNEQIKKTNKNENYTEQIKEFEKKEKEFKLIGEKIYENYNKIEDIINLIKKGKEKGFCERDIVKKINSLKQYNIKKLYLKDDRVIIEI
ncbi:MAG: NFACT family protein [Candidatus ainarchaeum sp.]|nr:NFACT family protein [Candidatus ainarchaeum sp.]